MKKFSLLLVLILMLSACSPAKVVGEYATEEFNQKFSTYVDMYNQLLYSDDSLSKQIDGFFQLVYAEGAEPNYDIEYRFPGATSSETVMANAEEFLDKEPKLPELDTGVRQVIDGSRKLIATLKEIDGFYVANTGDDFTPVAELDARLSQEIDEVNVPINVMNNEIDRVQALSDKQMIELYESDGNQLGAELLRATMIMHNFSRNLDRHLEGERVDAVAFEKDVTDMEALIAKIKPMASDDNHLLNAKLSKEVVEGAIGYFEKAIGPAKQMLELFKSSQAVSQDIIQEFDEAFFGYIDYYNESMR